MVNTATELGTTDAQVRQRTEAAFEVTRQALRSLLHQGRRDPNTGPHPHNPS
ncbi:hypothetical protein GCM10009727_71600 [Actinomadura napierensis]|uniref:RNA polymerase sigma-70 region 4 domain-containing protein n=1 Tax=Actinomadura napierensis TaxID=267854 RepID=A0ABP5M1K0_9ACTN